MSKEDAVKEALDNLCSEAHYNGNTLTLVKSWRDTVESAIAANKAAEEGGLPVCSVKGAENMPLCVGGCAKRGVCNERAAAGRASRQVANKAEVDLILQARSPEGDPWQEVFPADFFKAHANGYEVSVCVNAPGKNSIRLEVTPPATTGASTAELEAQLAECMQATHNWASRAGDADGRAAKAEEEVLSLHRQIAAEKLRADQGWQRAEAKSRECLDLRERIASSVGASTVLTDARIWDIWKEDPVPGGTVRDMLIRHTRAVLREVAAQAGQVALPEIIEAVMAICKEQQEFYVDRNRRELAAVVSALMDRIGYEFSSPAKESK